jgi:uncharacterized membrane protein YgcG
MNKYLAMLVTLVVTFFTTSVLAFTPPAPPANGWYVVDQAGKLSASQKQKLNHKIEAFNQSTKNEFGVLILASMDGASIEDVANTTFKAWGIGKKGLDNGVLMVISVAERKSRIETGKGVEGELTDLQCNDILRHKLAPHLKRGDFYGGISASLNAISKLMDNRKDTPATTVTTSNPSSTEGIAPNNNGVGFVGIGLAFLALIAGGAWALKRRADKKYEEEYRRSREASRQRAREVLYTPPPSPPSWTVASSSYTSRVSTTPKASSPAKKSSQKRTSHSSSSSSSSYSSSYTPSYTPPSSTPSGGGFGGGEGGGGGASGDW